GEVRPGEAVEQRRLLAAVGAPEALVLVHRGGDEQGPDDGGAGQGAEETQGEQQPAAGLGQPGRRGHRLAGPETERVEEAAGAGQAVAAEPPEQLLRTVTDEQGADSHPQDEKPEIHVVLRKSWSVKSGRSTQLACAT